MKKEVQGKKVTISTILLSIGIVILLMSIAVTLTLQFRPLYYFDIDFLDIPSRSGYTTEVIKENYNALINYNSILHTGKLTFPSIGMSETGEIHFKEVKDIFSAIQITGIILFIPVILMAIKMIKKRKYYFLKLSALLGVILPTVVGLLMALNWNAFFVMFHKLFFNNDYWVFDEVTDPVITILPNEYFMHCAVMILLVMVLFLVMLLVAYFLCKRRGEKLQTVKV